MPRARPTFPVSSTPAASPAVETFSRRTALARAFALPIYAALPAAFAACARGPHCEDTSALTPDDAKLRSEIAAYVEQSQDPTKHCSICLQFTAGGKDACGSCKVVKGPINPAGSCKLFQPKKA